MEDRYANLLKFVNFQPAKDESKSSEEITASGVAASSYVSQETQPWEYTIGEMGDFLRRASCGGGVRLPPLSSQARERANWGRCQDCYWEDFALSWRKQENTASGL